MEFSREEPTGRLRFNLADGHKGHDYYRGASGAPIANDEGIIVAVLVGGDTSTNELLGAPLHRYANLIGSIG